MIDAGSGFEFGRGFRIGIVFDRCRLFLRHFRKTEVQHLHNAIAPAHHYVFRFDIAMNDACFVRCIECGEHLDADVEYLGKL